MDLTFIRTVSRGGGLFSVFAAVACLGAMLVLASCGDDGAQAGEHGEMPMNMNGYFLTQGANGDIGCFGEDLTVTENADGTVDSTSSFPPVMIRHRGYKAENEGGDNTEIFGLGYVSVDADGRSNPRNPGVYYLQKISDDMYGGLWIGKPNRPEDGSEGMICPYIMVPDPDGTSAVDDGCPSNIETMLGDPAVCYRTNANGFVNPTPVR